jgi:hypothetical protein
MAGGGRITGRYALTDDAVATKAGAPVELRVLVDGRETFKTKSPNRAGWRPFSAALGKPDGLVTVSLVVTAEDVGRRYFCVSGELRAPGELQKGGRAR